MATHPKELEATDSTARAALARAIDGPDQLVLFYQPIHDARSGAVVAAEALLRQRRENGEVREAGIISAAAEASVGPELFMLDSMLAKQAFEDAARWQTKHPEVSLNFNLSPREFEETDIARRLGALLEASGIDPRRVNLEITETSYIESPEETVKALDEVRELGVTLWLDDFGTGHSSLTHYQHFPLAGLKIPGGFVKGMLDDARCAAIVKAIITLAHEVSLEVVAEEIETRAQLDRLIALDCELAQGFLFSRPMSVAEFERIL